jgi:hypothetical protein
MTAASRTLAVAVLRGIDWNDSPVFRSLSIAGAQLASAVYSNGSAALPQVGNGIEEIVDDGRNPGVGPRYLQAARLADERGDSFLLMLDHDFQAPEGWWSAYEAAVLESPTATCWAPRLVHTTKRLSPFVVECGTPRRGTPIGDGPWDASRHVALNSGLLIRTEAILMASRELTRAPLDFSDYALFHRLGRSGGTIAPVDLDLQHDSSTHSRASVEGRLARFAWFCTGAGAYADLDPRHLWPLRRWSLGRAIKLFLRHLDRRFLSTWKRHFLDGVPMGVVS